MAAECMFSWYWLADLCEREGMPFVLGHALYRKAIHGGKTKHDRLDAHKIAVLLRGGMIPMAYVYPTRMRATRDLLRRRMPLMRKRAELLAHIQNTTSQDHLPAFEKRIASGSIAPDSPSTSTTPSCARAPRSNLALIDIHRFPTVQNFAFSARLVTCAHESAGTRTGTSGKNIGNAHLTWAVSEAAVLCLRQNPAVQTWLKNAASTHGTPKALSLLAHKLGRAVYYMLAETRRSTCNSSWPPKYGGMAKPVVSLDPLWTRRNWRGTSCSETTSPPSAEIQATCAR